MQPNNRHTAPDQKFFYPWNGEIESHESFKPETLPASETLPGDTSFVVTQDEKGNTQFVRQSSLFGAGELVSGQTIDSVITFDYDDTEFENTVEYKVDKEDVLIFTVDIFSDGFYRTDLAKQYSGGNKMLLLPADEALPYGNDDDSAQIRFRLSGIIRNDDTLLTMPGEYGAASNDHTLDLCIANVHSETPLELALFQNDLGETTLLGLVSTREVLGAYLRYYDAKNDTSYLPASDMGARVSNLSKSPDDFEKYMELLDAARNSR